MPRLTKISLFTLLISALFVVQACAEDEVFHNGSVFPEFGKIASIEADMPIPDGAKFNILFDTAIGAEPGEFNKTLYAAARFMNMHAEAGVPLEKMKLAVVFHGTGSFDVANANSYGQKYDGAANKNADLVKALTNKGVRVILCGQSAAYHNISKEDLLPGVEMALSAMTAHALLQQEGYTLNPF